MNIIRITLALCTICLYTDLKGQNKKKIDIESISTNVKAAYMGSLIYPGFKVGIEFPTYGTLVSKGKKVFSKEKSIALNLGYYHHETFHDNLFLLVEWQMRRQKSSGFFTEFSPGIGISRTFLGGATYKVDDAGNIEKKTAAGYTYVMFSVASSVGYDFSKKSDESPFAIYLKPSLFLLTPANSFVYIRPTVELGVIYHL